MAWSDVGKRRPGGEVGRCRFGTNLSLLIKVRWSQFGAAVGTHWQCYRRRRVVFIQRKATVQPLGFPSPP